MAMVVENEFVVTWSTFSVEWKKNKATYRRTTFKFKVASLFSDDSFKINSLRCVFLEMGTVAR